MALALIALRNTAFYAWSALLRFVPFAMNIIILIHLILAVKYVAMATEYICLAMTEI